MILWLCGAYVLGAIANHIVIDAGWNAAWQGFIFHAVIIFLFLTTYQWWEK